MPELPEVETVRKQLEPVLIGQTITSVEVLRDKSWSGDIEEVVGAEIVAVERKAKVIFLRLRHSELDSESIQSKIPDKATTCLYQDDKDGNASLDPSQVQDDKAINYLMVHLKMTGQLIYEELRGKSQEIGEKKDNASLDPSTPRHSAQDDKARIVGGHPSSSWIDGLPDKHTRVVIHLSNGTLFFNDMRVFGWVRVVDQLSVNRLIGSMPPDIIDKECDEKYFYHVLQQSSRAVKQMIMDSQKIGGVGNIYACDGLFDAGIDPRRPARELSKKESDQLLISLKKVINRGVALGGATTSDKKFVNTQGLGGKYQNEFLVYEQEGIIVEKDGKKGVVEKFKLGGRGTYWVPGMQH